MNTRPLSALLYKKKVIFDVSAGGSKLDKLLRSHSEVRRSEIAGALLNGRKIFLAISKLTHFRTFYASPSVPTTSNTTGGIVNANADGLVPTVPGVPTGKYGRQLCRGIAVSNVLNKLALRDIKGSARTPVENYRLN